VSLRTDIPEQLQFRGIEPPRGSRAFTIALDTAEPYGGGRIEGRVERASSGHDPRPISVQVRCTASWLDVAPQLVGKKRILSLTTWWDLRTRAVPVWLEEDFFTEQLEVGALADANWHEFAFLLPVSLPRALEGTFVSFRWRVEARRPRRVGSDTASVPLLIQESQTFPIVRIETSPIGTWRLLERRSEDEIDGSGGPCAVEYAQRRSEDMPLPGETRDAELARRTRG
jgi:hypothetical protein